MGQTKHSASPVTRLAKEVMIPLTRSKSKYVDLPWLNARSSFHLSVQRLDLKTGQVVDKHNRPAQAAQLYTVPLPKENIGPWLRDAAPWEVKYPRNRDFASDKGEYPSDMNGQTTAMFQNIAIHGHLSYHRNEELPGIMRANTQWARTPTPNSKFLYCRAREHCDWSIGNVYRQCIDPLGVDLFEHNLHPGRPHVMATLSDAAPLRDDAISTSELTTLIYLAADVILSKTAQQHHTVIPVTLAACSMDTARIIQGIWHVKTGAFEIRKTPIMNFSGGFFRHPDLYYTLLGWLCAEPLGQTK